MIQNLLSSCVLSKNIHIKELTYESIILPVYLYAYQTWYINLSKEHRLRVFKSRVLRKMCGSKREEVTKGCRKALNKEHFDLYSSQKISRVIKSKMMFVDPCIIVQFIRKNPTRCNNVSKFYYSICT